MGRSVGRFAVQLTFEIGPANERANVKSSDGCVGDGDEREKKNPKTQYHIVHPTLYPSIHPRFPRSPMAPSTINAGPFKEPNKHKHTHTEPKVSFPHQPNRIAFPRRQENKKQNKAIVQHPTTAGTFFRALDNNDDDDNSQNKTKSSPLPRLRWKAIQNPCRKKSQRRHTVLVSPWAHWEGWIVSSGGWKDGNEGSPAGIQAAGRSKQTSNLKSSRER